MALTAEQQSQVEFIEAQQAAQIAATAANENKRSKADCLRMAQSIIFENRRLADANTPAMTAEDVTALATTLCAWVDS